MRIHCLLALLSLAGPLIASASQLPTDGEPPPRLVRYYCAEAAQVRALVASNVDIAAIGKGWVDVVMPARVQMKDSRFSALASAVRGLREELRMEDAEAPMRRLGAKPNLGLYHTLAEVKSELDAAATAHPDLARLSSLGKTCEGRDIWAIRIGSAPDGQRPAFLFTGATHAREWISIEVSMEIVKHLVQGYSTDPDVKKLVDEREVWVIPVVNPDGVYYSQTEYKLWRKNRRPNGNGQYGVDLNRNYGYQWGGQGASANIGENTYRGPEPFSEPETRAIRDLARAKKFVAALSFHSYGGCQDRLPCTVDPRARRR
jgi:hypothetical protein